MKRSQLIDALAARFEGNRKAASQALDAVVDTITREVARGERVVIKGFGTFERVLPLKGMGAGTKGDQSGRRSFVPEFVPGKDLVGVVTGKLPLPKVPRPARRAATRDDAKASIPEVPEDVAPVEPTTEGRGPTATEATEATEATGSRRSAAKRTAAKKPAATKSSAANKSTAAKKSSAANKSTAKKTTASKSSTAKKTPSKKTTAKKPTDS